MLSYLLIIVVAFSAVAISLIQLVGEYFFNQRIRDDQRIAETLAEQTGESLVSLDMDTLYALARGTADENAGRVLVVDAYGVVQLDTQSQLSGTRFYNQEVANVLSGA